MFKQPPAIEDNAPDEKDPPLEADDQAVAKEEAVAKEAEKEEEEAGPNMVEPENAEEVEEQVKLKGNFEKYRPLYRIFGQYQVTFVLGHSCTFYVKVYSDYTLIHSYINH